MSFKNLKCDLTDTVVGQGGCIISMSFSRLSHLLNKCVAGGKIVLVPIWLEDKSKRLSNPISIDRHRNSRDLGLTSKSNCASRLSNIQIKRERLDSPTGWFMYLPLKSNSVISSTEINRDNLFLLFEERLSGFQVAW